MRSMPILSRMSMPVWSLKKQQYTLRWKYVLGGSGKCLVCAHPWLSSHTSSMRSRMYGTQPIWLSAYTSFNFGNRTRTPDHRKSTSDTIALLNPSVAVTDGGASDDVAGIRDDEPMCIHTAVPVSAHASKKGSQ